MSGDDGAKKVGKHFFKHTWPLIPKKKGRRNNRGITKQEEEKNEGKSLYLSIVTLFVYNYHSHCCGLLDWKDTD